MRHEHHRRLYDQGSTRPLPALLDGEQVISRPGEIEINRSDLDSDKDFIIAGAGVIEK